jgi:hypothetical protein
MESTDLDMGEIFDDNDIDEDIGATVVLPDLEPTQSQDNEEDGKMQDACKELDICYTLNLNNSSNNTINLPVTV